MKTRLKELRTQRGLTLHSLRHTFVSVLYDLKLDPKRIQLLAGHASVDLTLNIYTHVLNSGTSPINEYLQKLVGRIF